MAVTEDVEVAVSALFFLAAPDEKEFIFLAFECLFPFHVVDAALSAPVLCNPHAEIGMDAREEPLTDAAVEEGL